MLEAGGIFYRWQKQGPWLLDDLSFSIGPGEIVGLPGPSGKGKSTLAKILSGYVAPHKGKITLDGRPVKQNRFNPVQLIFQHPELAVNPRWKIRDILNESAEPPSHLFDDLSIDPAWLTRYPHELSGGELQRICLARALDKRTRFLLCDEITSMLDALTQALIWKAVLGIAQKRNLGLLVISHDPDLIARICHQTLDFF